MKRYHKYILALLLFFSCGTLFAHIDILRIEQYGNVIVKVTTGHRYEETYKAMIMGKLAEILADQLGYRDPIFIDFRGKSSKKPMYFISYCHGDNIWINDIWVDEAPILDSTIVIRQFTNQFDAGTTLKLLEYAINNLSKIKEEQKEIEYSRKKIRTIDTTLINESLKQSASPDVTKMLSTKVIRPEENFKEGVSYFWYKNRYTLFYRNYQNEDLVIKELDDVYDLHRTHCQAAIIFDTESSFYCYDDSRYTKKLSQRHIINNASDCYRPYLVSNMGGSKISIFSSYFSSKKPSPAPKEQTSIYLTDEDRLIQDLDKLIEQEE